MSDAEDKLKELGYELPPARRSNVGNFVSAVRTGNLVYLSGTGPGLPEGGLLHVGKLGSDLTIEQGYDCARQTMLNLLTNLKGEIGDLDKMKRVVKLLCMINAAPDFGDTPRVANGASDLLIGIYGEKGRHGAFRRGHGYLAGRDAGGDRDDRRGGGLEIWPESGGSRVSGYTWSQQA